jgi:calcineurin-like phosphoesterase family protein
MDTTYLIEIRLGRTKWRIKQEIMSIASRFGLEMHMERHPHVTIFGPLFLNPDTTEEQILTVLGNLSCRYGPIPFLLDGWEKREGMQGSVIAFSVRPSEPLIAFTREVAEALLPLCESMNAWDPQPEKKWFHVTIANHLDPEIAATVLDHLEGTPVRHQGRFRQWRDRLHDLIRGISLRRTPGFRPMLLDETGLRLTIMKGEEILAEYDFFRKDWITTGNDHSGVLWQNTLRVYRQSIGFERSAPVAADTEDIFVISDLHFGHANIIRYCSRPFLFSDPGEMDFVLIENWNSVVSPKNRAIHIGDLRYGTGAPPAHHYTEQLRGKITFLPGNHDERELMAEKYEVLDYDGIRFLLIHDPADAPPAFDGWVIHGHHHNNDLRTYPFMEPARRQINVSAEVIGYVPISLREICTRIRQHQATGTTGPVLLRYPHV